MAKKSFLQSLVSLPEILLNIPYIKKLIKRSPKNPKPETISKAKSEIRKVQYQTAKKSLEKDSVDPQIKRKILQNVRSFSPERFEKFIRAKEILQPNESLYTSTMPYDVQTVYLSMRNHGVNQLQAQDEIQALQEGKTTYQAINQIEKRTLEIANILSQKNNVPLEHILEGMRKSDKTNDDWEKYVKMRKKEGWKARKPYSKMNGEEKAHFKEQVKENVYN